MGISTNQPKNNQPTKKQKMNFQNFQSYNDCSHVSPQQTTVNWTEYSGPPELLRNLQEYNQNYGQLVVRQESDLESQRKERRRERNRQAAARGRQRQIQITSELEEKVDSLTKCNNKLSEENEALLEKIEKIQFQLSSKPKRRKRSKDTHLLNPQPSQGTSSMSFTPLILEKSAFEFPMILSDDVIKQRQNSFSEINQILNIL